MKLNDLNIFKYPAPILSQVAEPVREITPWIGDLAARMIELATEVSGVGLACPQVGLGLRMFITCLPEEKEEPKVFINPCLSDFEGFSEMEEGCLSLPGIQVMLSRPESCVIEAWGLKGEKFVIQAADLLAKIVQHENDHLDGKLIIDRIGTVARIAQRKAIKQLEREYG
ncbi:MAG: peptide deformylase [Planctomycetes bacterium]|nr:peptide deformylase [Planctomycetota bacterium]